MLSSQLVDNLASASDSIFHRALGELSSLSEPSGSVGVQLLVEVVNRFIARGELGERIQADRVHAILRRLCLEENALSELALRSHEFSPGVRNSIAGYLPPAQRRLLLRHRNGLDPGKQGVPPLLEFVSSPARKTGNINDLSLPGSSREKPFSTVLLLAGPFQDANKQLLSSKGFAALVWPSVGELEGDLSENSDVCACLVDGSILQGLDKDAQRKLFRLLGSYSTFLWIRVEDKHLNLTAEEIRECLRASRCMREEVPASLLSIQPDAKLRESEVADIESASRALRARDEAEFIPGELTADQAKILMAAAKLHARELQIEGHVELKSLETKFLLGGRSDARIAVLRVNAEGHPLVAKIAAKDCIIDEMQRFRRFIEPWDKQLRPRLHFHGQAAALLFGLIPDDRDRLRPAEVLATRLEGLWNGQLFNSMCEDDLQRLTDALAEGVQKTAQKLGELNSMKPATLEYAAVGNPSIDIFEKLIDRGIDWGLPSCAKEALLIAAKKFKQLERSATIHGDVHLRNILLQGDRFPHLIDYAGSGPGHPSVDLVRLELALFLGPFRQIASEQECIDYQSAITFGKSSQAELESLFPTLHHCHLNKVCSCGGVAARDQALATLGAYGGSAADYQAAKYLVAWQNLVIMERHAGLARATILALAPEIVKW